MPSILVKNVDLSLLREINYSASKAELTQRDFVIKVLAKEVGWEHDEARVDSKTAIAGPEVEQAGENSQISHSPKPRKSHQAKHKAVEVDPSQMSRSEQLRWMREHEK